MRDETPLSDALRAGASGAVAASLVDPALEPRLRQLLDSCEAAWPGVRLPREVYLRYLGERLPDAAALDQLHAEDLYLCCACARGEPAALAVFEARLISRIPVYLGSLHLDEERQDNVRQHLRERLFVGVAGGAPKIAEYSGRGALGAWVRIGAVRVALNLGRSRDDQIGGAAGPDPDELLLPGVSPEMAYIRARYQGEFKAAIHAALAALPVEQRTLLRLHLLDGLSIDKLAPLFRVGRSTAARRLMAARQALLGGTRRRLQERLGISEGELDSLAGVVRSQLDLSLARVLREGQIET